MKGRDSIGVACCFVFWKYGFLEGWGEGASIGVGEKKRMRDWVIKIDICVPLALFSNIRCSMFPRPRRIRGHTDRSRKRARHSVTKPYGIC